MDVATGAGLPALLHTYAAAVWPAALVSYALAAVVLAAVFRPSRRGDLAAAVSLALLWLWTGIAWFGDSAGPVAHEPAWFLAGLFAAQAALLTLAGLRGALRFRFTGTARSWLGLALAADAAIAYPLTGALSGRPFPSWQAFGVTPWPVVVFTLAVLLLADAPLPKRLLVFPLLYAALALPSTLHFGPAEDLGMAVVTAVGVVAASLAGLRIPRRAARAAAG